jgi:Hypothetical glycosyl hydrolase family 15
MRLCSHPRVRRRKLVACSITLGLLTLGIPVSAVAAVGSGTSAAMPFRVAIGTDSAFPDPALSADRNGVVVLEAWQVGLMRQLKAANPGIKVLMYKDAMNSSGEVGGETYDAGYGPRLLSNSGVTIPEAEAIDPAWFLKDQSGQRVSPSGYRWMSMMDVGDPSYQRQWTDNVIAEMKANGWDGVLIDDITPTLEYTVSPGTLVKYPDDASWAQATQSFLAYAGPRIQSAGKLAVANIGNTHERAYSSYWQAWLPYVSGAMEEMYTKYGAAPGQGYFDATDWEAEIRHAADAEADGKLFLGVSHSTADDEQAARYGYASLLLTGSGNSYFSLASSESPSAEGDPYVDETWFSDYAAPLGSPSGEYRRLPNGVFERTFENGLVVVNPTESSQPVVFDASYSGDGLAGASSAALPSDSALILTRDSAIVSTSPLVSIAPAPLGGGPTNGMKNISSVSAQSHRSTSAQSHRSTLKHAAKHRHRYRSHRHVKTPREMRRLHRRRRTKVK